jgi:proline dehydrogenase
MLRAPILYLSGARWARTFITRFGAARRMAGRFVAGETMADAIRTIQALNARGINATLDHLGESVSSEADATRAADDYIQVLQAIQSNQARSNVSIKLTQFGLDVDEAFCARNVQRVVETARDFGNFVRIDMESSAHVEATLRVFRTLREHFSNVGIVLQSYLYRTDADLRGLVAEGAPVRLCKGAYQEPASVAYPAKADVDANYDRLMRMMLDSARALPPLSGDGRMPPLPALATHDVQRIEAAKRYADEIGLARQYFEFQMLHGIRRELQDQLARDGYAVRVYVPYGTEWYPYFMRRLAERPANVWFFLSNLVRR